VTGARTTSPVNRLAVTAFSVLTAATVAAFFITQHLKVTTPLLAGFPRPVPPVVDPLHGRTCGGVNHGRMSISFYLQHRADDVDVSVVNASGMTVRTLASGVHMPIQKRMAFIWNGRKGDGSLAPDGIYFVHVLLSQQGRTVTISDSSGPVPFKINTTVPSPRITSVTPRTVAAGRATRVTIRYTGNETRSGTILIYNATSGKPQLVKTFLTPWHQQSAVWDGLIRKRPAAPGTYQIALQVTDAACNSSTSAPVALAVR
jgi:FlgD Ig-like domain